MFSTPTADAFAAPMDDGNAATIARDSTNPSNVWIGSRLRAKRISRGMTQQELSQRLGCHCTDLNAHEAGTKRVSANLLLRIANLLEVHPSYFFQGYTEGGLEHCLKEPLL